MRAISQGLYKNKNTFYLRIRAGGKEIIRSLGSEPRFAFETHSRIKPALDILNRLNRNKKLNSNSIESYRSKIIQLIDQTKSTDWKLIHDMDKKIIELKVLLENTRENKDLVSYQARQKAGATRKEAAEGCQMYLNALQDPDIMDMIESRYIDRFLNEPSRQAILREHPEHEQELSEYVIKKALNTMHDDIERGRLILTYVAGNMREHDALVTKLESQLTREIVESTSQNTQKVTNNQTVPTLSDAFDEFVKKKSTTKRALSDKNLSEFKQSVDEVVEVLGDRLLNEYTLHDYEEFEAIMLKVPARYRVSKGISKIGKPLKFNNKSIREIAKLNIKDGCYAEYSISQKLQNIQSIYKWFNVTSPLNQFNFKTDADNPRTFFSSTEINKIKEYVLALPQDDEIGKWLFLIAIYTGARLNEIAQLTKNDIAIDSESNIRYFDINDDDGKELKNKQSKRQVPIHSYLLENGVLEFIDSIKEDRLFPAECPHYTTYSNYVNEKILLKIHRKYHIPKKTADGNRVFHSFRHTFIDHLITEKECKIDHVKDLVGHEKAMGITAIYSKRKNKLPTLKTTIEKLNFEI